MSPSVSQGILSKVVYYRGHPLIIETDARVNRGASGGMLVHGGDGSFLGLVTSNTKHAHSNVVFERINCSIPANLLHPLANFIASHSNRPQTFHSFHGTFGPFF